MESTRPVVLSIAGFDPSSGAGITADVKTCAAHGCFATCCITALTVQSTRGVSQVVAMDPDLVSATLAELFADLPPAAIRIGMLGSGAVAAVVAGLLRENRPPNVVLDPVLRSSSGAPLLDSQGLDTMVERILPLCRVITPNVDEAAILTGMPTATDADRRAAAERLLALGAESAVITGGHLDTAEDLLAWKTPSGDLQFERIGSGPKLVSNSTHGTGCAYATSVACSLALGKGIPEAVRAAKTYVTEAIRHARPIGQGTGPLEHLWAL